MYLRTTQRTNRDGSSVSYYQLAHNERDPVTKKPSAKVIHNFGRTDELDRDALVRLCRSIARVCGLKVTDVLTEGGRTSGTAAHRGLPEDVTIIRTVELGTVLLIWALWERLGIGPALREALKKSGCSVRYDLAAFAMTSNRLCEPASKLGVWERWIKKIHLPGSEELKLPQMYEAMDLMHEHMAEIERRVFFTTSDLLNLDVDVIFYDTTTATFSIDEEDEDEEDEDGKITISLRKRGRNKEGGFAPQIVVALAVTKDGLPVRSWVFPGNTADSTTVETVKADLKGWKLGRALFVADGGMNSEDNRLELARGCGKYLLASRMGSVKEIKEEVLTRPGRYKVVSENLHVKETIVGDGVRQVRYILCYNPREAERQRLHRDKIVEELKQELGQHKDKTATAQWAIELKASKRYGKYLKITTSKALELDPAAIKDAERFDGKWVVETNDDTLTPSDAASGYKALLVIERCFRSLKRVQIHLMPMHHWLTQRIETHVKICVLALLIERVAEHETGKNWMWIRETMRGLQATRFETPSYHFSERNEPPAEALAILKKLKIDLPNKVLDVTTRS
jgi:transposase